MALLQLFADFPDGRAAKTASGVDFSKPGANIETVAAQAETFLEAHRMEDKRTLGEYIAQRRRALGMTQRQFAEKLYVTDSAVSKWERGVSQS